MCGNRQGCKTYVRPNFIHYFVAVVNTKTTCFHSNDKCLCATVVVLGVLLAGAVATVIALAVTRPRAAGPEEAAGTLSDVKIRE